MIYTLKVQGVIIALYDSWKAAESAAHQCTYQPSNTTIEDNEGTRYAWTGLMFAPENRDLIDWATGEGRR